MVEEASNLNGDWVSELAIVAAFDKVDGTIVVLMLDNFVVM